jgi:hypothetical protein
VFDYEEARVQALPMKFACPSIVTLDRSPNIRWTDHEREEAAPTRIRDLFNIDHVGSKKTGGNPEKVDRATCKSRRAIFRNWHFSDVGRCPA